MAIAMTKFRSPLRHLHHSSVHLSSVHSVSSPQLLEESIRAAIEGKTYHKIPDLLNSSTETFRNPNPFSFLSSFSQDCRIQIIDDIIQSFIPLRPRLRSHIAYSCLLSYALKGPIPLPLALAILQRALRSGCSPNPQTYLFLSSAWIDHRHQKSQSHSVSTILSQMQSFGYNLDCGTCNYLISSLCKTDQFKEAVEVLKGMSKTGCTPDLDSFDSIIGPMCELRMITNITKLMKEMIMKFRLTPRQEMIRKVITAMCENREIWRAVEMIELLQSEGIHLGFESYELVVEGCLEYEEFVLAGKVVIEMTKRGFIPFISVRQKVVEVLANAGEWELACTVRKKFAELKS